MAVFALVHGAYHRGSSWQPLTAELEARGHRVVAPDLPIDDPAAGCDEYAAEVVRALRRSGDDLVVVGHAMGGLTAPLVAARRPVRLLVFLCALLPEPGRSFDQQVAVEPDIVSPYEAAVPATSHPDGSTSVPVERAVEMFYPDAPPSLARRAAAGLRRQFWRPAQEVTPLEEWPDVTSAYVLATADRVVSPRWARRAAQERLGVEAVELAGDHCPFLSRPDDLADVLEMLSEASEAG